MKKIVLGFFIALCGSGMFVQGKTEYKYLSEYSDSVLKRNCENIDDSSLPKRMMRETPCYQIDEALGKLDVILADIAEKRKPLNKLAIYWNNEYDAVHAKIQKDFEDLKKETTIPAMRILAGESPSTLKKEWEIAQEYVWCKRYSEIEQKAGWF
jgi:hypothetical protein